MGKRVQLNPRLHPIPTQSTSDDFHLWANAVTPAEKLFAVYVLTRQLCGDDTGLAREMFSKSVYPLARSENELAAYSDFFGADFVFGRSGQGLTGIPRRFEKGERYFDKLLAGPQPPRYKLLLEPIHFPGPYPEGVDGIDDYVDRYTEKARLELRYGPNECNYADGYEIIHQVLVGELGSLQGRRVVDLGCEIGSWIRFISTRRIGADGIGVDINSSLINFARANKVQAMAYDVSKPGFPKRFREEFGERRADAVTMSELIGNPNSGSSGDLGEPEARQVLENAHEILSPGGVCVIEPHLMYERTPDILLHTWGLPARDRFRELGFDVVRYGFHRGDLADVEFKDHELSGALIILLRKQE